MASRFSNSIHDAKGFGGISNRFGLHTIIFFAIMVVSCQPENNGINAEKTAQNNSINHSSFIVNSRGDSILTNKPIRIEGKYHRIDSTSTAGLLTIEQIKEQVKIKPDRRTLAQPEISLPEMDTMPYLRHSSLKTIPSKGETIPVRYPVSTDALKPGTDKASQVDIRYWGIDQNMATSSIWTMIQDKRGDLWFGSLGGGAIRFNGDRFDHFSESEGLGSNSVFAIHEDRKGNIWFGTVAGGVTRYDGEQFTRFTSQNGLTHNFVLSIIEDHLGNMWFGTRGGLCRYDGEQFTHYTTKEGLAFNEVISIYEDSKHQLWIGTGEGSGIHRFDGERFIHFNVGEGTGDNDVHSILEDKNGDMWFGTWGGGLTKYNGENFEKYTTRQGLPSNNILSILEGHDGALWFGIMGGGVMKYDGHSFINYSREVGLSSNDVRFVLEDDKNNIWACTIDNGVNRINPQGFQHIGHSEHLNFGEVLSIVQSQNGHKWLGTTAGLFRYDGNHLTHVINKESMIDQGVSIILEDRDQNLWLGGGDGLSVLSQSGKKDYALKSDLMSGNIRALLQDKTGHIWLGTYANGVIRYDGDGFTQFSEQYGFVSDDVYALFEDSNGHLWFGTHGSGAGRYDGNHFTILTTNEGLIHNSVRSIIEDHDGNMWFGTEGGLSKYDGESFENYTVEDGLIHRKIFSMILHNDKVWIATQKGISIFDPEENQFTNLDKSDVLGQQNLSPGNIIIDDQNKLWVGNLGGVVIVDLDHFEKSDIASLQLKIADIKINDQSIDYRALNQTEGKLHIPPELNGRIGRSHVDSFYNVPKELKVSHHLNHLTFHASAIDWNAPGKIRYSFYLKGVDKGWSIPRTDASMDYRNLPYGNSTLSVKAMDFRGVWTDPIYYVFTITPPWYHTWLAYFIYVLITGMSLYYLYRIILTRKIAIAEGRRLKDIDDLKTSIYTNITHEFRTPLTVINGIASELGQSSDKEVLNKSEMIRRNSQKLLSMVNQLLKLSKLQAKKEELNLQQADIVLFLKYLVASHDSLADTKEISLEFYAKEQEILMDFDADKVEAILINLISNAIKFTRKQGNILVMAEQIKLNKEAYLEISVQDSGVGISKQDLPFIFDRFHRASNTQNGQGTGIGLAIVKEFVSLMKGSIKAESTLGEGSRFIVRLPIERNAPFNASIPQVKSRLDEIAFTPPAETEPADVPDDKLPVLLIIEDNADIVEYLHHCLKDKYVLLSCRNGNQGIKEAIQSIPDIIISDVMMPGKDGFELCKILKEDSRTNHIPIILLTAKVKVDDRLKGLASGADAYLTKPFEKGELLIRLEKLLLIRETLQQKYLAALEERYGLDRTPKGEHSNTFLSQVESTIIEYLSNDSFSANELAGKIHLSRSQLNRKIKASTGMSTSGYIRHLRLLEAQKLLRNSDLPVTQILYQVGFNSPAYFSQAYKNLFGYTPSDERASSGKDNK